ncbi:MAG: DUF4255 domain-containing protein [Prochloraceae cyanobacterium]|nr:DUF4255 domain-containing protein [Prochloraceae cyanobacterium]
MSNYLAIASVTATIQQLLQYTVQNDVRSARVTTLRPDTLNKENTEKGVNIFLYRVAPVNWNNADLPGRRSPGQPLKRPHIALDLNYILTFYGNETQLEPQRILGSVVRTLYSNPILDKETIQSTIRNYEYLSESNLAEQIQSVKLIPLPISTEDLSKIWSVLFQTPYSLSVAYQASMVLIESQEIPRRALPVRQFMPKVSSVKPVISEIVSKDELTKIWGYTKDEPILATSKIDIQGKGLSGELTKLKIGTTEVQPQFVGDRKISINLSSVSGELLRAGVQGIQVIHYDTTPKKVDSEESDTKIVLRRVRQSNVLPFILLPKIETVSVSGATSSQNQLRSAVISISVNPTIGKTQRVVVLLNEINSEDPAEYFFDIPARNEDTSQITTNISRVKPGNYLVRVSVDGVESLLTVDQESDSPTHERYVEPKFTIS